MNVSILVPETAVIEAVADPNYLFKAVDQFLRASGKVPLFNVQLVAVNTSVIVSVLSNGTALPMIGVMASCAISSFIILQVGNRIIRYKASKESVAEESVDMICNS